jgi:hypothetical protein
MVIFATKVSMIAVVLATLTELQAAAKVPVVQVDPLSVDHCASCPQAFPPPIIKARRSRNVSLLFALCMNVKWLFFFILTIFLLWFSKNFAKIRKNVETEGGLGAKTQKNLPHFSCAQTRPKEREPIERYRAKLILFYFHGKSPSRRPPRR